MKPRDPFETFTPAEKQEYHEWLDFMDQDRLKADFKRIFKENEIGYATVRRQRKQVSKGE